MILSKNTDDNTPDIDATMDAKLRDVEYRWNKLVASLLQHQLQLRKERIDNFIENVESVDPISLKTIYFQWGSIRYTLGWQHARQSVMFPANGPLIDLNASDKDNFNDSSKMLMSNKRNKSNRLNKTTGNDSRSYNTLVNEADS